MKNNPKKRLFPILCCVLVLVFAPISFSACEKNNLPNVTITQTSTVQYDYSILPEFKDFKSIAKREYLVPGLNEGIVPQGMDVWEEKNWLFISGYFDERTNTSGSPSSMVVAVDLKTGNHVGTYCLKNPDGTYSSSHAGGVAITGKNLFISSGSKLHRVPLSQIKKAGAAGTLNIVEQIKVPVKASFCNYSNGVLWVGDWLDPTKDPDTHEWQHMTNNDGSTYYAGTVGYKLKDTASEFSNENWDAATMSYATPDYYFSITQKIQGFTFIGNQIALSKSHDTSVSHILVYDNVLEKEADTSVTLNGKSVPVWHLDSGVQVQKYNALPMSEGVTSYNGKLLVLFETGTKKYKNAKSPTDHVWSMTLP